MTDKKSLAQFITELREKKGLSASGLATKAVIPVKDIEDIESGQVLFLPSTIRQKIARVLKINPAEIKAYEKTISIVKSVSESDIEELKISILNNEPDLLCPMCHSKLITKIERMYDLENNLVLQPKAHCEKCTFIIK